MITCKRQQLGKNCCSLKGWLTCLGLTFMVTLTTGSEIALTLYFFCFPKGEVHSKFRFLDNLNFVTYHKEKP